MQTWVAVIEISIGLYVWVLAYRAWQKRMTWFNGIGIFWGAFCVGTGVVYFVVAP